MLMGYARVSTQDQNLEIQLNQLSALGCEKIFQEKILKWAWRLLWLRHASILENPENRKRTW